MKRKARAKNKTCTNTWAKLKQKRRLNYTGTFISIGGGCHGWSIAVTLLSVAASAHLQLRTSTSKRQLYFCTWKRAILRHYFIYFHHSNHLWSLNSALLMLQILVAAKTGRFRLSKVDFIAAKLPPVFVSAKLSLVLQKPIDFCLSKVDSVAAKLPPVFVSTKLILLLQKLVDFVSAMFSLTLENCLPFLQLQKYSCRCKLPPADAVAKVKLSLWNALLQLQMWTLSLQISESSDSDH